MMYMKAALLCSLVCVLPLTNSKALEQEATIKSKDKYDPCHAATQPTKQIASTTDNMTTVEHIMCGGRASGLLTELKGLCFDAERVKSTMLGALENNSLLIDYINSSMPFDTPSMTCDNKKDYLVFIYGLMQNLTETIGEIELPTNYCSEKTFEFIKGDLNQLSLKSNQVACSMISNGLHRIADVSSLPIGPLFTVNVDACADPAVHRADVLSIIYNLSSLVEKIAKKGYEDITRVCDSRSCFDRRSTTTGPDIIVQIVG